MSEGKTTDLTRREGETEREWLFRRLTEDPKRDLVNFQVSWGPQAATITPEERAAAINRVLDAVARGECQPLDFKDSHL